MANQAKRQSKLWVSQTGKKHIFFLDGKGRQSYRSKRVYPSFSGMEKMPHVESSLGRCSNPSC